MEASLGGKWLELLKEIAPHVSRVAYMFNPTTAPGRGSYHWNSLLSAARFFQMEAIFAPVQDVADIEAVLTTLARNLDGGIVVPPDSFMQNHRAETTSLAEKYRTPAVYAYREFVEAGGLVSYGSDPIDSYRRAASYVDRILRGEKPTDLPVQVPINYETILNLKTAKKLGIEVSDVIRLRADQVIE